METVFVVDPSEANGYYHPTGYYGYWDYDKQQILIFLFRFDPAEETIIERLCYVIEHEWLHELFARNVPYRYRGMMHYIIHLQQSWEVTDMAQYPPSRVSPSRAHEQGG